MKGESILSIVIELENDDLLKVTVNTSNTKTTYDVEEELAVDKNDLNNEYAEQSAKYAWWASLAESAKYQRDKLDAQVDVIEAEADYRARLQLDLDGQKITETLVKHSIRKDEEYKEAVSKYLDAKRVAAKLDKIVRAFDQRLDALISLGANMRGEYDNSDVQMLKKKAKEVISDKN